MSPDSASENDEGFLTPLKICKWWRYVWRYGHKNHIIMKQRQKHVRKKGMPDPMLDLVDLSGMQFGKWIVLKYFGLKKHYSVGDNRQPMWLCRCKCGIQKQVSRYNLIGGFSTQCNRCGRIKHGMSNTKIIRAWGSAKQRKILPKIWLRFDVFRKAVGDPPNSKVVLTRYDLSKPHSPENTLWATRAHFGQIRQKLKERAKEQSLVQDALLGAIRKAKSRNQKIRYMAAARRAGYTYAMIGSAASLTRQRIHSLLATYTDSNFRMK